jgi:hypothetical protein
MSNIAYLKTLTLHDKTYTIPTGIGAINKFSNSNTLFEGICQNSYISLEITTEKKVTNALFYCDNENLTLISNNNNISGLTITLAAGKLTSNANITGTCLYIGPDSTSGTSFIGSKSVSLDKIVHNGIATGNVEPGNDTPGYVYIQIS